MARPARAAGEKKDDKDKKSKEILRKALQERREKSNGSQPTKA